MGPFYHQLPVRSPVSLQALARAVRRRNDAGAVEALGELLKTEYDADEVLLTGSGTEALQLAILAAAQRAGDVERQRGVTERTAGGDGRFTGADRRRTGETEHAPRLALPAFTCFDVATAAIWNELPLLFYDIDPDTLAPDLESFERALDDGARVVVVNPLYGVPVPWEPLAEAAGRHGAVLIEDAAQGHGARWKGRRLGTLGEIGVLSFGRGKGWTGGRGGALLLRGTHAARDHDVATRALAPADGSALLATAAQWVLGRPRLYGIPASLPWLGLGETRFHEPAAPTAIPASAAALALASHAAAEREAAERCLRARDLARRLGQNRDRVIGQVMETADATPGYLRLPVRVPDARRTVAALHRWGVGPSYPVSIAELVPVRARLAGTPRRWPGAETLVRELVTLPTHGGVGDRDVERIVRGLADLDAIGQRRV